MSKKKIISVQNLKKYFPITKGFIFTELIGNVKAVDNISFDISEGKTLGLVGESGCGKSTTANVLLGLEKPTSGHIRFEGEDITQFSKSQLFDFRRNIQAVFQDPYRSLSPRKKVKQIISEPLSVHRVGLKEAQLERVMELLLLVGLNTEHAELYPHEFSGGQRQRIAVARALSLNPKTIILDEPLSALDVSIQAQILNLLIDLQKKLNLTFLIISHDLAVVEHISDNIGVMYLGTLAELAPSDKLYSDPKHPYTVALLESVPIADPDAKMAVSLEGEVPSPLNPPPGCRFHPRCPKAIPVCKEADPEMKEVSSGHYVNCHLF
ncbi:MAG: ATP-binding cassette domain-containing protein [Deltaproteobacteria bacterium]|nr:ATP-binding cassette domain-containing protein [Deltaproteobacteria bacterium]MBW1846655.1 ATP-binding cassette domain-containing protein [Deltaproteobacteria bacterium]MBW1983264.1 ATP-binding cassette domain-containing protein [Deltaproteobacteria bacterium]